MERELTQQMMRYVLNSCFATKKAMASELDVPYRTLLNAFEQKSSRRITTGVAERILHYCIRQRIPIENAIQLQH